MSKDDDIKHSLYQIGERVFYRSAYTNDREIVISSEQLKKIARVTGKLPVEALTSLCKELMANRVIPSALSIPLYINRIRERV